MGGLYMVNKELNCYLEIIGLLYSCNHFDLMTNDSWKHAALEHGIDSTALLNKFGALQKKYVNAFKKNIIARAEEKNIVS
jgi:hypothetical protein